MSLWIPLIAILGGGSLGAFFSPSPTILTYLRNLAAGVALAAATTELLPQLANVSTLKDKILVVTGIIFGATVLISIRLVFDKYQTTQDIPWEHLLSLLFDIFITSFLIGITSNLGGDVALVISLSLGFQILINTITISEGLQTRGIHHLIIYGIIGILLFFSVLGLMGGYFLGKNLDFENIYYLLIAFGTAALIWILLEELIVYNQDSSSVNSTISGSLVFLGFLIILIIRWLTPQS